MSNTIPLGGPDGPEYLEQGGGSPVGSSAPQSTGGGRRTALIAGGVVGALAIAGGAVALGVWWSSSGAQPAEALPDSTIAYASIDLDPSGEQKVEALRTLNKFPAFEDEVDIDSDDDIKQKLFERFELGEQCEGGLDYADDIEPWLGDRAAVAGVDMGGDVPDLAFVVQVKDADAAEAGMAKVMKCDGSADENGGWSIDGDWAVLAETDKIAQSIADDAADAPLSDDEDFQKWTDEAGDPGVLTMYAAPEAGAAIVDGMSGMFGVAESDWAESSSGAAGDVAVASDLGDDLEDLPEPEVPQELEQFEELLKDFQGAAVTVRFDDGALEMEMAGDAELFSQGFPPSDRGDDALASLPEDTAAALGVGFSDGWASDLTDYLAESSGGEMSVDDLFAQVEAATGLELPEDAEALFGESAALAVSPDIDAESFVNSTSPEGLPIGMKIQGDADEIDAVIEKLRSRLGPQADLLVTESKGDVVAVGVDEDYVSKLLEDGSLDDSDVYQNVIRESENASTVLYVNFDAGDGWLAELASDDEELAKNLEPLEGLGASGWFEDDVAHVVYRVTTN